MDNFSHGSTSLSTIAELVQTRLPRELRDHVYSFLWHDNTTKSLSSDYQQHLLRAGEVPQQVPDGDGNFICECKLSESMFTFTRSKFVGYQFAHEAVLWLYDNYQGFKIHGLENLHFFLETDVFHVGLSPASAQSVRPRRLSLQVDVRKTHNIAASLGQLTNRQLRHGFTLDITFNYVTHGVNLLASALETLKPVVTNLEDKYKVMVNVYAAQDGYARMNVKHMLGPWDFKRWCEWIGIDLASNLRTATVGGIPHRSTLRIRREKWALLGENRVRNRARTIIGGRDV